MATISRLSVSLLANTTGLRRGLRRAGALVKKFTGSIFSLKGAIVGALGGVALGAVMKESIGLFAKQQQAVAQLDASIKSMKRNTTDLSKGIQDLASQIQREGIIGDEAIIEGASYLSTYKEITDRLMPRTIRIMADLGAKMGSTTRAANLLGKASMGLVGALSIAGISLSDAAKESKDFEVILGEIEEQVGGVNKAMGSNAAGVIEKFGNALGDLKEVLGGIIAVAVEPFLATMIWRMDEGSKSIKEINVLGERFRRWLVEAAKGLAEWADTWVYIKQVIVGVKIVWESFVTAVKIALLEVAKAINFIADLFGSNDFIRVNIFQEMADNGMSAVADLKKEFKALGDELRNDPPSVKLKAEIDRLALQSEVDMMKVRLGLQPGGTFAEQPAGAGGSQRPATVRDPQLKDTNRILDAIRRDLQIRGGAVPEAVAG